MIEKILGTFISKIIITIIMFVIVIINTNIFGAEGTGTIALIILGMTLIQLLSNIVGGGAIVYLVSRYNFSQLVFLTYTWAILSNIAGVVVLYYINLIPKGFELLLFVLSLCNSMYYINITFMQGKEKIKEFNIFQLTQALILIISFALLILITHLKNIQFDIFIYILALIFSYFIPFVISLKFIHKNLTKWQISGLPALIKVCFVYGFWVQLANITQLLNYRLSYYFIEHFSGRKSVGIFELGTKLSEVVWIFPKSIALVQYASISNRDNKEFAKKLTASCFKLVFIFTILAVLVLMSIPSEWITFIFGNDFTNSKNVIITLAPGIVFLSALTILSHYFSGLGKYWVNTISSFIGFIMTLMLSLLLLPDSSNAEVLRYAGLITSTSYLSSLLFSIIIFINQKESSIKLFLISKNDLLLLKKEIKNYFKR